MKSLAYALAASIAVSGVAVSTPASALTIFGVDEVNNLVSFDSATPGTLLSSTLITGTTESFQALDFRPANGVLYGLGSDRVLYTINTSTGVATAVGSALAISGITFGFDFNPTNDRLRIISNTNESYVVNPNDGTIQSQSPNVSLASSVDPDLIALAYTGAPFGGTTTLYGIDSNADTLDTINITTGLATPIGALGANFGSRASFDIAGSGEAFAYSGSTLYRINLATGAATTLGTTSRALFGIAAVPEPTTWGMMIAGFGLMGGLMRRRARPATSFA